MKKSIQDLINKKLISQEKIGFDQIINYIERAQKDLMVAEANFSIDMEASYNYAYLSMLRSGRALMFSFGYRPIGNMQHKTVILFSEIILGKEFLDLILKFDRMRKFRNKFTYDVPGTFISEQELKNAFNSANKFTKEVFLFIQKNNPQLDLLY